VITGKPVKLQGFLERNPGGQAISELKQDLQNVLEVWVTERSTMFTPKNKDLGSSLQAKKFYV